LWKAADAFVEPRSFCPTSIQTRNGWAGLRVRAHGRIFQRKEIEEVWVIQKLGREFGLRRRQGALEIGNGLTVLFMNAALNLERKDIASPAVFEGLLRIKCSRSKNQGECVPSRI
jgi:hypothetical protein